MGVYRITARLDLNDPDEKRAAEYLTGLKRGELNRFVVAAVLARLDGGNRELLEQIRQLFREEVRALPAAAAAEQAAAPTEDLSVLDDLELFA